MLERNYLVRKNATNRELTITQLQSLRALYGAAVHLVRTAGEPFTGGTGRPVMEKDFEALRDAIEMVKQVHKKGG